MGALCGKHHLDRSRITCGFAALNSPCISSIPVRKHFSASIFHAQGNSSSVAFFLSCSESQKDPVLPGLQMHLHVPGSVGEAPVAPWEPLEEARMRNPISHQLSGDPRCVCVELGQQSLWLVLLAVPESWNTFPRVTAPAFCCPGVVYVGCSVGGMWFCHHSIVGLCLGTLPKDD